MLGTFYLVMEFLEGMDLESRVRQHGPMPASRAVYVLRQVCDSLEEAHARGLVHRDIKPANIHLGRVGYREDFVKVLDFGLVKTATSGPAPSLATLEGMVVGTPAYMAPGMALGEHVDGRADLYALGCVAYYLLTGAHVFTGDTVLKVITQHMQAVPVPPSVRTELPIPATLEHLVLDLPRQRSPTSDHRTHDSWRGARRDRRDDVDRGGRGPVVEPAPSASRIDIRRGDAPPCRAG